MKIVISLILFLISSINCSTIYDLKKFNGINDSENKWYELNKFLVTQKDFYYFPVDSCSIQFKNNNIVNTVCQTMSKNVKKGFYKIDIKEEYLYVKIPEPAGNLFREGKYCSYSIECHNNKNCEIIFNKNRIYQNPKNINDRFNKTDYLILYPINKNEK